MELEYSTVSSDVSTTDSDTSQESTQLEDVYVDGLNIQLPQDLCENKEVFKQFFSYSSWQESFTEEQKQHLKRFLPTFPSNDEAEKEKTLRQLLAMENIRFGNPLEHFFNHLKNGHYSSDIARLRHLMKKAERRAHRYQKRRYLSRLLKELLVSRQQHLEAANCQPPGVAPRLERIPNHAAPKSKFSVEQRARRRYFQELQVIRQEVGESEHSSEDDNYPEGPPAKLNKKQKRQLSALECSLTSDFACVTSTLSCKPTGFDLEANVTANFNPYEVNEDAYRAMLLSHKRRRQDGSDMAELDTQGITLQDVEMRTQIGKRLFSKNGQHVSEPKLPSKKKSGKNSGVSLQIGQMPFGDMGPQVPCGDSSNSELPDTEEDEPSSVLMDEFDGLDVEVESKTPPRSKRANSLSSPRSGKGKAPGQLQAEPPELEDDSAVVGPPPMAARQATLSDLDGIDMMNLPVDLEDEPTLSMAMDVPDIKPTPELMQETHACFFSLIRDVICSTPEHRMSLPTLEDRLKAWQESPISPLNDWYCVAADSWSLMLPSAISFLSGDYPDAQPDDFVPYLEHKAHLSLYQWIGAGRDSDSHLMPLCRHWLDHREEMVARPGKDDDVPEDASEGVDDRACSPPPPRYPTSWVVRPASPSEKEMFREQERQRYEHPHRAFTYRMHGYESVVGPVKGVYNQSVGAKPRGHSLLVAERPNFVTILALVRDATARLPNGEGTRSDICELLKDSQYLAPITQESYLHSVVSGALDRLHYEPDPCVKYDTKRKIWIYLHRGRCQEEFERLHQQQQGMAKPKKSTSQRKTSRSKQHKESVSAPASSIAAPAPQAKDSPSRSPSTTAAAPHKAPEGPSSLPAATSAPSSAPGLVAGSILAQKVGRAQRPVSLAAHSVQNLQVSTPSGIQAIQVTNPPVVLGKSLLPASVASAAVQGTSIIKTVAASSFTSQQPQNTVSAGSRACRVSPGRSVLVESAQGSAGSPLPAASTAHQKAASSSSVGGATLPGSRAAAQLLSMSQIQLVNPRSPQQQQQQQTGLPVLAAGKALVTAGLSGMKLVKGGTDTGQTIFIKQAQPQSGDQLQHAKQAAAIAQLQQQLQLQQQQQQQQQQQGASLGPGAQQRLVTSMSVLNQGQPTQRVVARVGGQSVSTTQQQQQAGGKQQQQQAIVAKVLTNAQGQVLSMESLLTHQKQGAALRVAAAGKAGQTSLIQIPSSTPGGVAQFAVVSQGNLLSVGQPRVLQTQIPAQVTMQSQQQQVTKLVSTVSGKPLVASVGTATTTNLRMLNPSGTTGINLAHIGGKPVLLASKAQASPMQGSSAQNMILTSQAAGSHQTVVLAASQAIRAQGGSLVLQQGSTQQILLPPGFQGGTLNIKTLPGLQGLKVIPLSQTAAAVTKGRQQVYARIISPGLRPSAPGATVTLHGGSQEPQVTAPSSVPTSTPTTSIEQ